MKVQGLKDAYLIQQQIGQGATGQVFKAICQESRQCVAIKFQQGIQDSEKKVIQKFKDKHYNHLINILDFFQMNMDFIQVMELADTSLFDYMYTNDYPRDYNQRNQIFLEIVKGVEELHKDGYFHRDLKPENVVIVNQQNGKKIVKLCDYGLTRENNQQKSNIKVTANIGTPYYMPPEQQTQFYHKSVDLWALGTVWYELHSLTALFNGNSIQEIFNKVKNITQEQIDQMINNNQYLTNEKDKTILKHLLVIDPDQRLSINILRYNLENPNKPFIKDYLQFPNIVPNIKQNLAIEFNKQINNNKNINEQEKIKQSQLFIKQQQKQQDQRIQEEQQRLKIEKDKKIENKQKQLNEQQNEQQVKNQNDFLALQIQKDQEMEQFKQQLELNNQKQIEQYKENLQIQSKQEYQNFQNQMEEEMKTKEDNIRKQCALEYNKKIEEAMKQQQQQYKQKLSDQINNLKTLINSIKFIIQNQQNQLIQQLEKLKTKENEKIQESQQLIQLIQQYQEQLFQELQIIQNDEQQQTQQIQQEDVQIQDSLKIIQEYINNYQLKQQNILNLQNQQNENVKQLLNTINNKKKTQQEQQKELQTKLVELKKQHTTNKSNELSFIDSLTQQIKSFKQQLIIFNIHQQNLSQLDDIFNELTQRQDKLNQNFQISFIDIKGEMDYYIKLNESSKIEYINQNQYQKQINDIEKQIISQLKEQLLEIFNQIEEKQIIQLTTVQQQNQQLQELELQISNLKIEEKDQLEQLQNLKNQINELKNNYNLLNQQHLNFQYNYNVNNITNTNNVLELSKIFTQLIEYNKLIDSYLDQFQLLEKNKIETQKLYAQLLEQIDLSEQKKWQINKQTQIFNEIEQILIIASQRLNNQQIFEKLDLLQQKLVEEKKKVIQIQQQIIKDKFTELNELINQRITKDLFNSQIQYNQDIIQQLKRDANDQLGSINIFLQEINKQFDKKLNDLKNKFILTYNVKYQKIEKQIQLSMIFDQCFKKQVPFQEYDKADQYYQIIVNEIQHNNQVLKSNQNNLVKKFKNIQKQIQTSVDNSVQQTKDIENIYQKVIDNLNICQQTTNFDLSYINQEEIQHYSEKQRETITQYADNLQNLKNQKSQLNNLFKKYEQLQSEQELNELLNELEKQKNEQDDFEIQELLQKKNNYIDNYFKIKIKTLLYEGNKLIKLCQRLFQYNFKRQIKRKQEQQNEVKKLFNQTQENKYQQYLQIESDYKRELPLYQDKLKQKETLLYDFQFNQQLEKLLIDIRQKTIELNNVIKSQNQVIVRSKIKTKDINKSIFNIINTVDPSISVYDIYEKGNIKDKESRNY